ncbi:hypothetical protein LguiB_031322 [Lonicera macranthoides]
MEREFISRFHFPPGFRFHPSDEELIEHYLHNKVNSRQLPADIIAEIELYNYNPWDLLRDEWYFFSPRYRKYPNGARPNRMAASGFWKATGPDKPILTSSGSRRIGVKKALVFYTGRPPRGHKTEWVMTEYRLPDTLTRRGSMRLDDWVLCRIRQKGNMSKNTSEAQGSGPSKPVACQPEYEELLSAQANPIANTAIIQDTLFKECHIVASILAGHNLPPIEAISSTTTFSSTDNSKICGSTLEDDSSRGNTGVKSSSFDNFLNSWKGKPNELLFSTMKVTEDNENEDILGGNVLPTIATNFSNQNQSQGNIFNPNLLNTIMNLQECNDSAFLGRFLQ